MRITLPGILILLVFGLAPSRIWFRASLSGSYSSQTGDVTLTLSLTRQNQTEYNRAGKYQTGQLRIPCSC